MVPVPGGPAREPHCASPAWCRPSCRRRTKGPADECRRPVHEWRAPHRCPVKHALLGRAGTNYKFRHCSGRTRPPYELRWTTPPYGRCSGAPLSRQESLLPVHRIGFSGGGSSQSSSGGVAGPGASARRRRSVPCFTRKPWCRVGLGTTCCVTSRSRTSWTQWIEQGARRP